MHAIASSLVGFPSSTLRVRIIRAVGDHDLAVVTADLLDAGTTLVLSREQVAPEPETASVVAHRDALTGFAL